MASAAEIVLVVDDELEVAEYHASLLRELGFLPIIETDPRKVFTRLSQERQIRLILLDIRMPQLSGLELLPQLRLKHPTVGVIIATVVNDIPFAVEAIKTGAYNYLLKPVQKERLDRVIQSFLAFRPPRFRDDPRFSPFITAESCFEPIFQRLLSFSSQEVPVLITGETGTGKEILASLVHTLSNRSSAPFVPVNISALSANLFESEIFGHVKGAFTGANIHKKGFLETAEKGTLFIDEIGELPLEHQAKLLRVLQDGVYHRVGSTQTAKADSRFVFATNRNLHDEVRAGKFREDLFYRIANHTIHIPPLRERPKDIEALSIFFLKKYSCQYGRYIEAFTEESMSYLKAYPFPGNVRELEGMISAAVLLEEGLFLQPSSLPLEVTAHAPGKAPMEVHSTDLKGLRKHAILAVLAECGGNQTRAASKLGIARTSLNRILRRFDEEEGAI